MEGTPVQLQSTKRSKPGTPPGPAANGGGGVIDLTDSPDPKGQGNNNNEEEDEEEEEEEEEEAPTRVRAVTAESLEKRLGEMARRMERVFGVSFANSQNAKAMEAGFFKADWKEGYAPARTIEDASFYKAGKRKYGGMDLHTTTSAGAAANKVKMVFKTPSSVDTVLCVPYYMLAEQVKANTRFLRNLNSRVLPGLDLVLYELAILIKAIRRKDAPASLREAASKIAATPILSMFPLPRVSMPVTPDFDAKNTGIDAVERRREISRQMEEKQLAKNMEEAFTLQAIEKKEASAREANELIGKMGSLFRGGGGGGQEQQQTAYKLPPGFEELPVDEKLNRLMGAFYTLNSNTDANNVRLQELEETLPRLEQTMQKLQSDVSSLRAAENNDLFGFDLGRVSELEFTFP